MALPADIAVAVESLLAEVDDAAPALVDGVYVTGSVALDDFQHAISDIDMVAVCGRQLLDSELDMLEKVHRPSRPNVDACYVTWDHLRVEPTEVSVPHSLEGTFHRDGGFAANPVEWRTLQTRAVRVRGSELADGDVWFDPLALRRWNLDNLDTYWAGRLEWWRGLEPTEKLVRWEYGLQWLVLGVPRLHYTIATPPPPPRDQSSVTLAFPSTTSR